MFVWLVFSCLMETGLPAHGVLEWKQDELTLDAKMTDTELFCAYDFENKSPGPVHILSVHPSCSCFTATASAQTVEAGGKAVIKVVFKLDGKVGPQNKTVIVETDDGSPPKTLVLKVNLPQWITFTSESLTWTKGEPREAKSVDVDLMPGMGVSRVSVSSSNAALKVELQSLDQEGKYRVILRPLPGDAPLKASIKVHVELKSGLTKNAAFIVSAP